MQLANSAKDLAGQNITMDEVKQHNTQYDDWTVYNGKRMSSRMEESEALASSLPSPRSRFQIYLRSRSLSAGMLHFSDEPQIAVCDLKHELKELDSHEKGFDNLFLVTMAFVLFCVANYLRYDTSFTYSINNGLLTAMKAVAFHEKSHTYLDVQSRSEFAEWLSSAVMDLYMGEVEDVCGICPYVTQCASCYNPVSRSFSNVKACSSCSPFLQCFDGKCIAAPQNFATTYPFDWSNDVPLSCEDKWVFYGDKGMTTAIQGYYNGSGVIPYSDSSGKIANQVKIGGMATVTWQRRKYSECSNEEIRELYGTCKDSSSLLTTEINTTTLGSPMQVFPFNEEANANYALIDFGSYNFGGWFGFCLGPNLKSSEALKNAEKVDLKMILVNGQRLSMYAMVDFQYTFTPGGYVEKSIDVTSFPVWKLDGDSATYEIFYVVIMFFICFALPILVLAQRSAMFFWKHRKMSCRTKFYLGWDWAMKAKHIYGIAFFSCGLCCAGANLYSYRKIQTSDFQVGKDVDISTSVKINDFISKTMEDTVLMDQIIESIQAIHATFLVTVFAGLLFLLQLMEFHKRLALVKQVLGGAAQDLIHLAIVFIMVLFVVAMICTVLFGPYSCHFNSLKASLTAILRIGLGTPGDIYDEMLDINAYTLIGPVIVFCIQIIIGLVLLNIIISICCDSLMTYEAGFDRTNYWGVVESFLCYLTRKYLRMKQHFCTDLGFERRGHKKWQDLICMIFAKSSPRHKSTSIKTIPFSIALDILESSPCGRYYAKLALAQAKKRREFENGESLGRTFQWNPFIPDFASRLDQLKLDNIKLNKRLKDAQKENKDLQDSLSKLSIVTV